MAKSKSVQVRLDPDFYNELEKHAEGKSLCMSTFIRSTLAVALNIKAKRPGSVKTRKLVKK